LLNVASVDRGANEFDGEKVSVLMLSKIPKAAAQADN
jgi:hypothetical protein